MTFLLQHTAIHCNTLQHIATHTQHISARTRTKTCTTNEEATIMQRTIAFSLQHTTTHCNILQPNLTIKRPPSGNVGAHTHTHLNTHLHTRTHTHPHTHPHTLTHTITHTITHSRTYTHIAVERYDTITCMSVTKWVHTHTHKQLHIHTHTHRPTHLHTLTRKHFCCNTLQHIVTHTHNEETAIGQRRTAFLLTHTTNKETAIGQRRIAFLLQRTATHCNTLQHTHTIKRPPLGNIGSHFCCKTHSSVSVTHCDTLQHAATRCNTLAHTVTNYDKLHHQHQQ